MLWRIINCILGVPSPSRIGSPHRPTNWLERWERRVDITCDTILNDEELTRLNEIRLAYMDGRNNL